MTIHAEIRLVIVNYKNKMQIYIYIYKASITLLLKY
jgi:hypothetical protein